MKFPPSLSGKGIRDTELNEDRTLFELSRAIKKVSPKANSALLCESTLR